MGRYGHGYGVVDREKNGCRIHELLCNVGSVRYIAFFCCLPFTVLVLCCMLLTHTTLPMCYVVAFLCIE